MTRAPYLVTLMFLTSAFALLAAPVTGQAADDEGFQYCVREGYEDLSLVFLNEDLRPRWDGDGLIHASGKFFIQFQARGEKAFDIDSFKFSFGKGARGVMTCDSPEWVTEGAYIKNYRSDNNWEDGFFVPINTYNVGDGEYVAAVSAYDAEGNELVRGWAHAIVENGGRTAAHNYPEPVCADGTPLPCPDFIKPWPMVLPGDGKRLDGGNGLYIEIAEEVSEIKAYLNNKVIPLTEVTPPPRDDDVIPDTCPPGQPPTGSCEGQVRNAIWGQAWTWDGQLVDEDIIRVEATDLWGNRVVKILHLGDPTHGGRVSGGMPEVEIEFDNDHQESDENGRAVYNVTYRVTNDEFAHANVEVESASGNWPKGVKYVARPNHVMIGGDEELRGTIEMTAGPEAPLGNHKFELVLDYLFQETRIEKRVPLTFAITQKADSEEEEEEASKFGTEKEQIRGSDGEDLNKSSAEPVADEKKGLPGPGAVLVALAAAGAAALGGARRRRS